MAMPAVSDEDVAKIRAQYQAMVAGRQAFGPGWIYVGELLSYIDALLAIGSLAQGEGTIGANPTGGAGDPIP